MWDRTLNVQPMILSEMNLSHWLMLCVYSFICLKKKTFYSASVFLNINISKVAYHVLKSNTD